MFRPIKNLIVIIFLLFITISCKHQEEQITFHPIVLKAKETSLYSKEIDWKNVNKRFIELTEGKETTEELKEGLQFLINSLGDRHASIRSAKDHSIVVSFTGETKGALKQLKRDTEFANTVINDVKATFQYKMLQDSIGYLKVVGIGPGDVKLQSNVIRNGLKALNQQGATKWILDLRFNGGGNIEPMISGLAPLIGEGFIGGGINSNDEVRTFEIKDGQFYNYNRLACEMDSQPELLSTQKVAVLLSRYTASSGELLAISFKGRQNTKFIGEPTAGYTTGNGYDKINEALVMLISQDVFIDRNKNIYKEHVNVDTEIPFEHTTDLQGDNQIESAVNWLKK